MHTACARRPAPAPPRCAPSALAWFMYALLLGGRRTLGWQGIKAARATVGGFIVVLASYFVHTL